MNKEALSFKNRSRSCCELGPAPTTKPLQANFFWEQWLSLLLNRRGKSSSNAEGRQHHARGNLIALSLQRSVTQVSFQEITIHKSRRSKQSKAQTLSIGSSPDIWETLNTCQLRKPKSFSRSVRCDVCRVKECRKVEQDRVSVFPSSARFLSFRLFFADLQTRQTVTVPYLKRSSFLGTSLLSAGRYGPSLRPSLSSFLTLSLSSGGWLRPLSTNGGVVLIGIFPSCLLTRPNLLLLLL